MDPEETNVEVEVEEETTEATPESEVEQFANDVSNKAEMVANGDMTVADFVSECMEQLGSIEVAEENPMGGLGEGNNEFPPLEDLESEA